MKAALCALLRGLTLSVFFYATQSSAQQTSDSGQWREIEFFAHLGNARVYDKSVEGACRKAGIFGYPHLYYKGDLFKRYVRTGGGTYASCQAEYGGRVQSTPVYMECSTFKMVDGVKTRLGTGAARTCYKPPPVGCATGSETDPAMNSLVGNPVDITCFAKVTRAVDWSAPNEPRFRIARNYRSDGAFNIRFRGIETEARDLFANTWQREYSGLINLAKNPHDPADTRDWFVYEDGNGRFMYFRGFSGSVGAESINADGYKLTRGWSSSTMYITGPDGSEMTFYDPFRSGFGMQSIKWPDGYTIYIELYSNVHPVAMTDNKGNKATFLFNQNVVPGVNRHLISEIVLSRQTSTGYVETGRLVYGYNVLSYPAMGGDGNSDFSVEPVIDLKKPVITSVDYMAAGSAVLTPVWRYTYATFLPPLPPNPDGTLPRVQDSIVHTPLLTSISDGGAVPYAEYTYKDYGFDTSNRYLGFGVATEKYAGDARETVFEQASSGSIHRMINPNGLASDYTLADVKGSKKVVAMSTAESPSTIQATLATVYGPDQVIESKINRNGSRTVYTRNSNGRVLTIVEDADGPAPRTTSYTWHDTLTLPLTRTVDGLTESFTYDSTGLLLTYTMTDTKPGSPTLNQSRTWTYGYTSLANALKVLTRLDGPGLTADGINDVTTFTYTATGDLASTTDPMGLLTSVLARNTNGQPTLVEQPDLSRWSFTYDANGRILTAGFAGQGQTALLSTFTYNHSGQIVTYKNTRGETWTFTYNAARRLTQTTSPTGDKVTYTYDAAGNVTKEEYNNGSSAVTFWEGTEFDGLSRILKTLGAMGQTWTYSHDVEDNLAKVTDPLSKTTTNAYDKLNRLISTIDREAYTTGMDYNPADQLTEYTDPRAIETDFTYNGFGEVITEVSADRGTIAYTYDRRGLVTSRTDGRGITSHYTYDNGGRLTLIDYPAATLPDIAFTYDTAFLGVPADSNKGHVAQITDGIINTQFGHEVTANGPRITATSTYPAARIYSVIEETDFEGNPTRTVYPSGREVLFDVDDANRLTRIRLKDDTTFTTLLDQITYAPNGPMKSALYGDGYTQTRTYDFSYRLTGLADALGATKLRDLTYGYEGRDNLTSVTDLMVPTNTEAFTYTPRESLTTATGPYGALAYTYDGVGNRLTAQLGAATDIYTYPATSNQLSVINLATGGSRAYTYDAAGNVVAEARTGGSYGYTYNAAGRMETFSINGFLQAQYKYDAMGRQAIRTLTSPTPVTIHSVFDSEGRRIAEYNETSGALIREYVWNGWEPVAVIEGGAVSFIRADHIGRPVFATNAGGTKAWEVSYLPFGGVRVATGSPTASRFPGQWYQTESGLHQNWMRDYDPTSGRYLEPDPLGLIDGASVYGYALQNPGRWIDPRGEETTWGGDGPISVPVPMWPGESYPGELGGSMIDGINWLNQYNPAVPLLEYCCAAIGVCTTTNDCDAAFETENQLCRMLYDQSSRRQCFQQAQRNYAECLRNAE